jgi:hypothetical protein
VSYLIPRYGWVYGSLFEHCSDPGWLFDAANYPGLILDATCQIADEVETIITDHDSPAV